MQDPEMYVHMQTPKQREMSAKTDFIYTSSLLARVIGVEFVNTSLIILQEAVHATHVHVHVRAFLYSIDVHVHVCICVPVGTATDLLIST